MAAKLTIDYNLAFDLYSRGLTYQAIGQQLQCNFATIRSYGHRHDWKKKVESARLAVAQVVHSIATRTPQTVQKRAELWQEREIVAVERITDALDSVPIPEDIKGLKEHVEVRAMNGKYGRSTFGLDQAGVAVQINIGRVGPASVQPITEVEPSTGTGPIIDVDNSTLDSQSSA